MGLFVDYRGVQVRSPNPTGDGGLNLNNDLKTLANRAGPIHSAAADPTANDDSVNTAGNGKFYPWSKWHNTVDSGIFVCVDGATGAAVWHEMAVAPQVTKILYADSNRTDSYTEDGSILKPYKTVQAAIAIASGDVLINVAPGTYTGDVDLGLHVTTIRGGGLNATLFTGNMTAGDRAHTLEEFRIRSTGSLTVTDLVTASNLHLQCPVIVSGSGSLDGKNIAVAPNSGIVPLTMNSTGECVLTQSFVFAQGNTHAIDQTSGTVVAFHSYLTNNSFTTSTVNSSSGVCGLIDSSIFNQGAGESVHLDNSGNAVLANTLAGLTCTGNIACTTTTTYVEGLNFIVFGALTGTNLVFRPASRLDNDSVAPGATVADALADLDSRVTALGG